MGDLSIQEPAVATASVGLTCFVIATIRLSTVANPEPDRG
jgi:hypothetical protein